MLSKEELIAFEQDIAACFERGEIHAPIHLHGGNEDALIEIFKHIKESDWVFTTHRSHYHALLKGIPEDWVKREILNGHSINLSNREYKFFSSAIVGGILPIAVGVAMGGEMAWCFVGDMAAETGIFHECVKYSSGHNLPIKFVVEDNGFSVDTPTELVWGYSYKRTFPHQGIGVGKFVIF